MFDDIPASPGLADELATARARLWRAAVAAVAIGAGALALLAWLDGCATADPREPLVPLMAVEMQRCVATSPTREESRRCREGVRSRYPELFDGGAHE